MSTDSVLHRACSIHSVHQIDITRFNFLPQFFGLRPIQPFAAALGGDDLPVDFTFKMRGYILAEQGLLISQTLLLLAHRADTSDADDTEDAVLGLQRWVDMFTHGPPPCRRRRRWTASNPAEIPLKMMPSCTKQPQAIQTKMAIQLQAESKSYEVNSNDRK